VDVGYDLELHLRTFEKLEACRQQLQEALGQAAQEGARAQVGEGHGNVVP
jgi:hypothetical protein